AAGYLQRERHGTGPERSCRVAPGAYRHGAKVRGAGDDDPARGLQGRGAHAHVRRAEAAGEPARHRVLRRRHVAVLRGGVRRAVRRPVGGARRRSGRPRDLARYGGPHGHRSDGDRDGAAASGGSARRRRTLRERTDGRRLGRDSHRAIPGELLGSVRDHQLRSDDQLAALLRPSGVGGQTAPSGPGPAPCHLARVLQGHRSCRDHTGERSAGGVFPPHPGREPALPGGGRSRLADRPGRGVHHAGRARRRVRLLDGRVPRGRAWRPLDLQRVPADALFPGQYGIRPFPADASLAGRVPTRRSSTAPPAVKRAVGLLLLVAAAPPRSVATAQQTSPYLAAERAESLRLAGRPWHAAGAGARPPGRPARGARGTRLGRAGARDSAAAAYAAARAAGLPAIDAWLRLRQARVTRDTAVAFRLLADLPAPAAREANAARAQALLAAGDSASALEAFAQAGRSLDLARLALAHGDSSRARDALYGLMARAPETDDAAAAVGVALATLRPRTAPERVALARAMKGHGAASDARLEVERALR